MSRLPLFAAAVIFYCCLLFEGVTSTSLSDSFSPIDLVQLQWAQTSEFTQPAPSSFASFFHIFIFEQALSSPGDVGNSLVMLPPTGELADQLPPLYWGNTAKIIGVRPQNSTTAITDCWVNDLGISGASCYGMRMDYHAEVVPLSQEYLIRPRFLSINYNLSDPQVWVDNQVVTITPDFHAFQIADSVGTLGDATVEFHQADLLSVGREFLIWASNPSGSMWTSPDSATYPQRLYQEGAAFGPYNRPDVGSPVGVEDAFPVPVHVIEFLVACRWSNGTDCAPAPVGVECEEDGLHVLGADGFCWQLITSPFGAPASLQFYTEGDEIRHQFADLKKKRGDLDPLQLMELLNESSSIMPLISIMPRPLQVSVYNPLDWWTPIVEFDNFLYTGFQHRPIVVPFVVGQQYSHQVAISFPLVQGNDDVIEFGFTPSGSVDFSHLKRFLPGLDNAGGTVTITIAWVVELEGAQELWNDELSRGMGLYELAAGNIFSASNTSVRMEPSSITISKDEPVGLVRFTGIGPVSHPNVSGLQVFFYVQESDPSVLAAPTGKNSSLAGQWRQGAYYLRSIFIHLAPIELSLANGPGSDSAQAAAVIVSQPEELADCATGSYQHVLRLSLSPASLNQSYVRFPFNITGVPSDLVKFWVCPSPSAKRQTTGSPIIIDPSVGFEFLGDNTALSVAFTTTMPIIPENVVVLTFLPATPANSLTLDPSLVVVPEPITLILVQTTMSISIGIPEGSPTHVLYMLQPMYIRLAFSPPTRGGFNFVISGLYTQFDNAVSVNADGTSATYFVPGNVTAAVFGPIRVIDASPLTYSDGVGVAAFSVGLQQAGTATDYLWYTLESVVEVEIVRHSFYVLPQNEEVFLLASGAPSEPLCIFLFSPDVLGENDTIWLTLTRDGIIFEPVIPSDGAVPQPPVSLVFTHNTPRACFTARRDPNRAAEFDAVMPDVWISGPSVPKVYTSSGAVTGLPLFTLWKPEISVTLITNSQQQEDFPYAYEMVMGDQFQILVSLQVAPPTLLSYQLRIAGVSLTPLSASAGNFTPTGELEQLWGAQVLAYSDQEGNVGSTADYGLHSRIFINLSGPDGAYYSSVDNSGERYISVHRREAVLEQRDLSCVVGAHAGYIGVELSRPVVHRLVLRPTVNGVDARLQSAVRFEPSEIVFTPETSQHQSAAVIGVNLGTYRLALFIDATAGQDALWTDLQGAAEGVGLTVFQRFAPTIGPNVFELLAGAPQTVTVTLRDRHEMDSSESLTVSFSGGDKVLVEPTFITFSATSATQQYITLTYTPTDFENDDNNLRLYHTNSGPHAWKYESSLEYRLLLVERRSASLTLTDPSIVGVRYSAYFTLADGPSPVDVTFTFRPNSVVQLYEIGSQTSTHSFVLPANNGTQYYFEYEVNTPMPAFPDTYAGLGVSLFWNVSGGYLFDPGVQEKVFVPSPRLIQFDFNHESNTIRNPLLPETSVFMVRRESPVYTITVSPALSAGNTMDVTLSSPYIRFTPSTMQFSANQLTASFSFMPLRVPPSGETITELNIIVTGSNEAQLYDYSDLTRALKDVQIIPELGFSPIPPAYPDEDILGLSVWIVNASDSTVSQLSIDPSIEFVLRPEPGLEGPFGASVHAQPGMLQFTKEALSSSVLSQTYSIFTTNPSIFHGVDQYLIRWYLRYQGQEEIEITPYVPLDAQRVILRRYQIIPDPPKHIHLNQWQTMGFNLTRAVNAPMSLLPHMPQLDGQPLKIYGGTHVAGGSIVFDPLEAVFVPGAMRTELRMMVQAGSDQRHVYYRVDWEIVGHADDTECYLDAVQSETASYFHFSTWYVASAFGSARLALTCVFAVFASILYVMY